MLLAVTAAFVAEVPRQSQAPSTGVAASSRQPKGSEKASASGGRRKIPCKAPENASQCYWTRGRLSVYEGAVTFRIWKVGTRRMLGVFSGPSHYPVQTNDDMENPEFPSKLEKALEADNRRLKRITGNMWTFPPPVFADFEVCPLRPEEKGVRQPVCIESARNIFVQDAPIAQADSSR